MYNRHTSSPSGEIQTVQSARSRKKAFILWRELLPAYLAPAIMAGIGGIVTADWVLQLRAATTIGGSSLLVALCIGLWLRNRGAHHRWIVRTPRILITIAFALGGLSLGMLAAWGVTNLLPLLQLNHHPIWLDQIGFDFPVSGAIACTTMTWRWRGSLTK
ncbi:hypothetical protein [Paenibacillus guangzhouensis]|uniref:hypothetical protein n=1 Tax=Paenibacillus guangzhouensis TaxID=1473112 RepID=UPI0012675EAE|nr:hypothetical protein [Paenibacillus guangzhouensis]